jgi:hypothetical protein
MAEYGRCYPEYGFERHKGYGTAAHIAALRRLGPLVLHRRSYAPIWSTAGLKQQLEFWDNPDQFRERPWILVPYFDEQRLSHIAGNLAGCF